MSIDDHNQAIIDNWNLRITNSDIIIHLGDFAFGHTGKACSILPKLNGKKLLVPGNHDEKNLKSAQFRSFWTCITPSVLELQLADLFLVLCHFPIESWNHMYHGSIHLHGHCHSSREHGLKPKQLPNRLDVGVDYHNLTPLSLDDMLAEIKNHNDEISITTVESIF